MIAASSQHNSLMIKLISFSPFISSFSLLFDLKQKIDIFTVAGLDVIFTADHVLSIQQLSNQYILEYERKQDIVKSVISCQASSVIPNDGNSDNNWVENTDYSWKKNSESCSLPWVTSEEINQITLIWRDDCEESYIDVGEGKRTLWFLNLYSPTDQFIFTKFSEISSRYLINIFYIFVQK